MAAMMATLTVFLIISLKQLVQIGCSCLGEERAICLCISSLDSGNGGGTISGSGLFGLSLFFMSFPLLSLISIFIGAMALTWFQSCASISI